LSRRIPANFSDELAAILVDRLLRHRQKIVFAESCTAGLISASLGRLAGVSEALAGSAVVYQLQTKSAWLGVSDTALETPGPVSQIVSEQMARGVLEITPHATIAVSVTGHLGPQAPQGLDGIAWSTVAVRGDSGIDLESRRLSLLFPDSRKSAMSKRPNSGSVIEDELQLRRWRQFRATELVLQFCIDVLDATELSGTEFEMS
jgi:nicotinamide-nucleotide amidase